MATEEEKKDAETAEKADDNEDADYKAQAEPGHQSDEGYIQDDAEKAEQADDDEDQDYEDAINAMDDRYAQRKDVEDLKARMDALEAKFGAGNKPDEDPSKKVMVSLDGTEI